MISDEELAVKIKYGDTDALDMLVRRYHSPIHAYIVRMGVGYHQADDIVQEVFIKLIRSMQSYETARPFKPWLYTIASNTYKDYFKKAYVKRNVLVSEIEENNQTSTDGPEDIFMQREKMKHVADALHRLSEIHREVVILRYYQDLKLDEIAATLDIPTGTVKSRLFNALQHLKELLSEGAV